MSSDSSRDEEKEALTVAETAKEETSLLKPVKHLDDFIRLGWYCLFFNLAAESMVLTSVSSMLYMVYAGLSPSIVSCGDVVFNSTQEACSLLPSLNCTPTLEYSFESVNVEFSLLCSDSKLVKNAISWQMLGVLIGAFVFGQVSDAYGRKKALLISLSGIMVASVANYFVTSFAQFVLARMLVGFFTGGINCIHGVFFMENLPKDHRMWINQIVTWSPNFIIYPYICYLLQTWRNLVLWNSVIAAVAVVLISFVYESPRWLIQQGRLEEARRVINGIRRIDGNKCEKETEEVELMLEYEQNKIRESSKKKKTYSYYHIFCTWKMVMWTGIICFGVSVTSLINYSLLFNMEKLTGSLYVNNAVFGVIRWSLNIFVGAIDHFTGWLGRKTINTGSVLFNTLTLAAICATFYTTVDQPWIVRYGTIGITAMCSQLYLAKYMIASELYPTAVRNLNASALQLSSRLGTIIAPQLFYLGDISKGLPYVVLFVACIIDLVIFQVFVPETKNRPLENHLPPKEERIFYKKPKEIGEIEELP